MLHIFCKGRSALYRRVIYKQKEDKTNVKSQVFVVVLQQFWRFYFAILFERERKIFCIVVLALYLIWIVWSCLYYNHLKAAISKMLVIWFFLLLSFSSLSSCGGAVRYIFVFYKCVHVLFLIVCKIRSKINTLPILSPFHFW